MPTLAVVRHAKAGRPSGVDDVDRPLTERGRADARAAGAWLADRVGRPDLVVCSPARRAVETATGVLAAYASAPPVVYEERVYEATTGDLLRVVRGLDPDAATAVLVGHDPAASALVSDLCGSEVELKTCGVAVLQVPTGWADTPPGGCELVALETVRA